MRRFFILGSLLGILVGKAQEPIPGEDLFPKVQAVFQKAEHGCMRCHGVGARLPLPTTEAAYFEVGSRWVSENRDPATSKIYSKLRGNPGGVMPPLNPPGFVELNAEERALIAQWVRLGPVINEEAVCTQRAKELLALINDLNDDQLRKGLTLNLALQQNTAGILSFDVNYLNAAGETAVKDQISMKIIEVILSPEKIQKRCVVSSLQRDV